MGYITFVHFTIASLTGNNIKIKSSKGSPWLGGRDIDKKLELYIRELYDIDNELIITNECENIKIALSVNNMVTEEINDTSVTISRNDFENICGDLWNKCLNPVEASLQECKMNKSDITHVILVGGSSRIPKIRNILAQYFPNSKVHSPVDINNAIAKGACIVAVNILKEKISIQDQDEIPLLSIEEIITQSLGLGLHNGKVITILPSGTPIPANVSKTTITSVDNQTKARVVICQGESSTFSNNQIIGTFIIEDIPPKPQGEISFTITFSVNSNGVLTVSASADGLNLKKELKITNLFKNDSNNDEIDNNVNDRTNYVLLNYLKMEALIKKNSHNISNEVLNKIQTNSIQQESEIIHYLTELDKDV